MRARKKGVHLRCEQVFIFMRICTQATGCDSPRNAYRWLRKWAANTTHHRLHIAHLAWNAQQNHSKRMTLIAETLQGLLSVFGSGKNYQRRTQKPFFVL